MGNMLMTSAGALVSRILGFIRDAAMAWMLGTGLLADVFLAALRIPDVVRRLLGEGTLSLSLTASCSAERKAPARLGMAVARIAIGFTAILVVAGELFAPEVAWLVAPGLPAQETAGFLRLLFPYVLFAVAAACGMAVLHSTNRFVLPSCSPVVFNICVLAGIAFAWYYDSDPAGTAMCIGMGVLCGGVTQTVLNLCPAVILSVQEPEGPAPDAVRHAQMAMPGGILVAAAPQLVLAFGCVTASMMAAGSLASLFYAERLLEFPLGLTAAAVGTVAAPAIASKDKAPMADARLTSAIILSLSLALPATAGLAAIGAPLVRLLFMHGAFDAASAELTTSCLYALLPGLPAYAVIRPLTTLCLAHCCRGLLLGSLAAVFAGIGAGLFFGLTCDFATGPALGTSFGLWTLVAFLTLLASQVATIRPAWDLIGLCITSSMAVFGVTAVITRFDSVVTSALSAASLPQADWISDAVSIGIAVPVGIAVYLILIWPARKRLLRRARSLNLRSR